MKTWQIALIGLVLVVVLYTATQTTKTVNAPRTSNDVFTPLVALGVNTLAGLLTSQKPSAPSAVPTIPANFDTGNYSVSNGFEFTDANGNFVAG